MNFLSFVNFVRGFPHWQQGALFGFLFGIFILGTHVILSYFAYNTHDKDLISFIKAMPGTLIVLWFTLAFAPIINWILNMDAYFVSIVITYTILGGSCFHFFEPKKGIFVFLGIYSIFFLSSFCSDVAFRGYV